MKIKFIDYENFYHPKIWLPTPDALIDVQSDCEACDEIS